jgi:hypothetical protein
MANLFATPSWSIELPDGWQSTHLEDHVKLEPPDHTVRLLMSDYDPVWFGAKADGWVEAVAQLSRRRERSVTPVRCGDFSGYLIEFESQGTMYRDWVLRVGDFALEAACTGQASSADRHYRSVVRMLNSLRFLGVAA